MREKYHEMTGLQIVKRVKATAIKDGLDAQYFGHGLIHPLRALDMEDVIE